MIFYFKLNPSFDFDLIYEVKVVTWHLIILPQIPVEYPSFKLALTDLIFQLLIFLHVLSYVYKVNPK